METQLSTWKSDSKPVSDVSLSIGSLLETLEMHFSADDRFVSHILVTESILSSTTY